MVCQSKMFVLMNIVAWAEIAKSTNKEFKEVTKETTDFYIRYRQNKLVDQTWKIDFDGRIYEIVQVEEDFLNHDLTKIKGVLVK
ncbi:phage head closure protein [Latilactobacillus sakei]